jgi:hypothetical protein
MIMLLIISLVVDVPEEFPIEQHHPVEASV